VKDFEQRIPAMASKTVTFRDEEQVYHADTCVPLEAAVARGQVRLKALARGTYPGGRMPKTWLPGLKTVGYWDARGKQEWGLDWHRNEGIELTFLETGRVPFAVDGTAHPLQADDLAITRPWQCHRVGDPHISVGRLHWVILDVGVRRPNQDWRWPAWFILSKEDIERLTDLLRHNEQPVWPATREIRYNFQQIAQTLDKESQSSVLSRLTVHLNELFLNVLEMLHYRKIELNPKLSSGKRTVEWFLREFSTHAKNLKDHWTVADMASQCGLGVTAFTQYCREIVNMTPTQFLNHQRIDEAIAYIRTHPEASITDAALELGFSSSQYFATVFKQVKGCTPKAFKP
jgi:AraC family transcriptional regulator, 4-hydroxyphenylacetate 3-monooxygenase operon regulatory protein